MDQATLNAIYGTTLNAIYGNAITTSHLAGLQAVYDRGVADGFERAMNQIHVLEEVNVSEVKPAPSPAVANDNIPGGGNP